MIETMGRVAGNVLRIHHWIQKKPVFTIAETSLSLKLSTQTIINCLERLKSLGIVREVTGGHRNQVFIYDTLLKVLNE